MTKSSERTVIDADGIHDDAPASVKPSRAASVLVTAIAAVVLAGGFWSLGQEGDDHAHDFDDAAVIGETVELPEGLIRVDAVRPEIMAAMLMPASLMPDSVPDGFRRFVVDMSLVANTTEDFDYDMGRFSISGEGLDRTPVHRSVTRGGTVPPGSQATVSMLFDAPLDIEPLYLHIEGTDRVVLLDGDLGDGHSHGEAPNDLVISGFFELEIEDFVFLPDDLIIAVDTDIRVHNHDLVVHDVVFRDGSWDTGNLASDANSEVIRFSEPGTYDYFCSIHPTMTGTINVVSGS